jgi:hypothetical protein
MDSMAFSAHFPASPEVQALLARLGDRGVVEIDGNVFSGDSERGLPPEEALVPTIFMAPSAAPLSAGEYAAAVTAIRVEVLGVASRIAETAPMSVGLVHARYCMRPAVGVDVDLELIGLVDRTVHVVLA